MHSNHGDTHAFAGLQTLESRVLLSAEPGGGAGDGEAAAARQDRSERRRGAGRAGARLVAKAGAVAEGNPGQVRKLTFTVKRQGSTAGVVTVKYVVGPSGEFAQASAGADFASRRGKLTFAPGVKTQKITVNVLGDNNPEFDETVRLDLFGARGATIRTPAALGTILDDDADKEVDLSITADTFNPDPNLTYPPTLLPVTMTFTNFGTAASGATRVQFFVGNFDPFDNLTGYVDVGAPLTIPSVPGGGAITRSFVLDFNQAFIFNDSWSAFARVLLEDTNMTNNTRYLGDIQLTSNNT